MLKIVHKLTFCSLVLGLNACSILNLTPDQQEWQIISKQSYTKLADLDKDGVIQVREKCQSTPIGLEVNNTGCPNEKMVEKQQSVRLYFQYLESELGPSELSSLFAFMIRLSDKSQWDIQIRTEQANNPVFNQRYEAIKKLLTEKYSTKISTIQFVTPKIKADTEMKSIESSLTVYFPVNSYQIEKEDQDKISQFIANHLANSKFEKIQITGHTSIVGSAKNNLILSQKRAERFKNILVEQFNIAEENIITLGLGESKPAVQGDSPYANAQNRRTELTLVKSQPKSLPVDEDDGKVEIIAKSTILEADKRWHIYSMENKQNNEPKNTSQPEQPNNQAWW